ncbi:MAG: preprotein translocase subunit SecE [Thermoleophilaceae bacterium]|nr:preprotein translocase subunit SecE [Thermoleophilaceae bacterium]
MAQKRQRSKQRQADRRAQRLSERGSGAGSDSRADEIARQRDPERQELEANVDLEVGAPPEELGHSDFTTRHEEPPSPDFETDDEELIDAADGVADGAAARGPRGVRGGGDRKPAQGERTDGRRGARLLEFFKAVVAELQRVQWPNRRQLFQLTGVVLFFVVIVGAYLGALDAVLNKLIQQIL